MTGKAGVAPCGHPGFHVVGNYVQCASGCDRVAKPADFEDEVSTEEIDFALVPESHVCPRCGSGNSSDFGAGLRNCLACGKVF